ncbi:hypothetical protein [Methylococcus sp. EFPC2]|uniref:hypothetical protein n=1 Tax=Methylococcus sp. EFPC2 TaxID=2812648 RepID=UPI001967F5EF|nr:hypothetical protein [Methylococcus sp. EFPC2]QSA97944.1 hypothetical protein JWZ97_03700 [Methylococcus sp. EFPC2]
MKTRFWVLSVLVLSSLSGGVLAADPPSLGNQLEGIGKKAAEDAVKSATPDEVKQGVKAVDETARKAKATKDAVQNAPAAIKEEARGTAEKAVKDVVPEGTKETVKAAEESAEKVRKAPKEAGKAAKSAKGKAKKGIVDGAKSLLP